MDWRFVVGSHTVVCWVTVEVELDWWWFCLEEVLPSQNHSLFLPAGDIELRSVSWSLVLSPGRWMCYLAVVTVFLFFCFDPKYSFFVLFFFLFLHAQLRMHFPSGIFLWRNWRTYFPRYVHGLSFSSVYSVIVFLHEERCAPLHHLLAIFFLSKFLL